MNIKNIYDNIASENISFHLILSNIISLEVRNNLLIAYCPNYERMRKLVNAENILLSETVKKKLNLDLELRYSNYEQPVLPYPAKSSKFGNYILFFKQTKNDWQLLLIRKKHLQDLLLNRETAQTDSPKVLKEYFTDSEFDERLSYLILETLPVLKERWSYLHPVYYFDNYEKMDKNRVNFERIINRLSSSDRSLEIKRFVGAPCFTVFDYFKFGGVK